MTTTVSGVPYSRLLIRPPTELCARRWAARDAPGVNATMSSPGSSRVARRGREGRGAIARCAQAERPPSLLAGPGPVDEPLPPHAASATASSIAAMWTSFDTQDSSISLHVAAVRRGGGAGGRSRLLDVKRVLSPLPLAVG